MRSILFSTVALLTLACSMDAPSVPDSDDGPSQANGSLGTGNPNSNGSNANSANSTASENANGSGSPSAATEETNPTLPLAGTGSTPPTAPSGNAPTPPSSTPGAATPGMMGGMPGMDPMEMDEPEDLLPIARPIEGVRIDDPCTGAPSTAAGATCNHVMNPFHVTKEVTLAGTAGTIYDVTLRIRGVVEPTRVNGGTRADTSTVNLNGRNYRAIPFTAGGTVGDMTFQPWLLSVSNPAADFYLNDYQLTEHTIFKIDYQVTLQMAGNSKVTLDVNDANDHEIDNYARLSVDGIPPSSNLGQFVQLAVVSVKPH